MSFFSIFFFFFCVRCSTESGQDNPFRPDGDLSREADELVELLKGGRPISEVLKNQEDAHAAAQHDGHNYQTESSAEQAAVLAGSPRNASSPSSPASKADSTDGRINGSLTEQEKKSLLLKENVGGGSDGGSVEVQRAVVAPVVGGESQVEHVVIKKKSKCQCCVIQ